MLLELEKKIHISAILTLIITQRILSYLRSPVLKVLAVLKREKNICLNTKLVGLIEIFSFIHTRFISSLPFRSPGRRLGMFPTTNLMDFALMGLEWEYIVEYFTTYITSIFPFRASSFVRLDVVV
jgi:hypothetical protein